MNTRLLRCKTTEPVARLMMPMISRPLRPEPKNVLLYSKKWSNGIAMWWGPNQSGYFSDLNQAGRYTMSYARAIAESCHWEAIPIREEDLWKFKIHHIIDEGAAFNSSVLSNLCEIAKHNAQP